jgi:FdhE protein
MSGRHTSGASTARAARARELNAHASPAAGLLGFYAALVEYQQRLVERWNGRTHEAAPAGSLLRAIDAEWVGCAAGEFVSWLVRLPPSRAERASASLAVASGGGGKPDATNPVAVVPPDLRAAAEAMRDVAEAEWRELFESYRTDPDDAAARFSETAVFALEAVLQPIAEHLAARLVNSSDSRGEADEARPTSSRCPICGGAPVAGVLREAGHGARRQLVCGLCLTEWDYLRLVCVKCGEQRFEALPVFSAEQIPHARADACDTCRSYLKTLDATRDGHIVPVVDDLATVALDLWVREQGYVRVRTNLVRI